MEVFVQYLEGGSYPVYPPADEVRARLQSAAERLPLSGVLLGWDLPPALVEACAEECARLRTDLYAWIPLLSGHGRFRPDPDWRVIGLAGQPVGGHGELLEFTFVCPNRPAARAAVLQETEAAIATGPYQGVFLDRIRFPSPAANPARDLGCFCDDCSRAARQEGVDLPSIQADLQQRLVTPQGRQEVVRSLLSLPYAVQTEAHVPALRDLLTFRQGSIATLVGAAAENARARGLRVGLDCYSPTLSAMVGQDLAALSAHADWTKVMTYARAHGPASLPFEILALADWLIAAGELEAEALKFLAAATGWPLPERREALRRGGLAPAILTEELRRGREAGVRRLFAGIELVEVPGVSELQPAQIRADAEAALAAAPDGIVFSWDLWHMPKDRLEDAAALYGRKPPRSSEPWPTLSLSGS